MEPRKAELQKTREQPKQSKGRFQIVKLEERCPETRLEYSAEWEPFRRYDQYLSPRDL